MWPLCSEGGEDNTKSHVTSVQQCRQESKGEALLVKGRWHEDEEGEEILVDRTMRKSRNSGCKNEIQRLRMTDKK